MNYSTSICPSVSGKFGKKGKKLQKFEYLEIEKSFLDEIKNTFHSFWRAIIWWKNKYYLIKDCRHKFQVFRKLFTGIINVLLSSISNWVKIVAKDVGNFTVVYFHHERVVSGTALLFKHSPSLANEIERFEIFSHLPENKLAWWFFVKFNLLLFILIS